MNLSIPQSSLFNFVVYTDDARRLSYFQEIIRVVVEQYPCSVILLLAQQGDKGPGDVHIETQDKITIIKASGEAISRIPFLFFRHLVPAIPIYLLWGQEPFIQDPILPYLEQYCTRLIYDSESCDNLSKMGSELVRRMEHLHGDIVDMNWARMVGWRRILSQTFDNEIRLNSLQQAKLLRIKFNNHHTAPFHHCETQAYYLQAWLSALFGWKFERSSLKENTRTLNYSHREKPIVVELIAEENANLHPGTILSIECNAENNHYLMYRLKESPKQVRVEITMETTCELPFTIPIPSSSAGMVLLREILFTPPSEHYMMMIRSLAQTENSHVKEVMR